MRLTYRTAMGIHQEQERRMLAEVNDRTMRQLARDSKSSGMAEPVKAAASRTRRRLSVRLLRHQS